MDEIKSRMKVASSTKVEDDQRGFYTVENRERVFPRDDDEH